MSLTITQEEEVVTVIVTSDPESCWPPLCQILWNMCHIPSPVCDYLKRSLRVRHHTLLGGIQMLVGVLSMYLVASLENSTSQASSMTWLGFVFITSGMVSILAEEVPYTFLVILSVVLNLLAATLAFIGLGLYIADLHSILEIVLIILAVLQIIVNTCAVGFGMNALTQRDEEEEVKELLKEVEFDSAEKINKIFENPT